MEVYRLEEVVPLRMCRVRVDFRSQKLEGPLNHSEELGDRLVLKEVLSFKTKAEVTTKVLWA